MAKQYNPQTNGTLEKSKQMYAEIGLCYECGRPIEVCEREMWNEYMRIYPIFEKAVFTLTQAVSVVYGTSDLTREEQELQEQTEWIDGWGPSEEYLKSRPRMTDSDTRSHVLP